MRVLSIAAAAMIVLVMMSSSTDGARGRKSNRIAKGEWGGMHINLNVTDSSASIEYDCAHGEITGPLTLDRRGRFDLKGTHSREHGGPVRINEPDNSQPARYTGFLRSERQPDIRSPAMLRIFRMVGLKPSPRARRKASNHSNTTWPPDLLSVT